MITIAKADRSCNVTVKIQHLPDGVYFYITAPNETVAERYTPVQAWNFLYSCVELGDVTIPTKTLLEIADLVIQYFAPQKRSTPISVEMGSMCLDQEDIDG